MDINMKDMIDRELERMVLSEEMKSRIRERAVPRRRKGRLKWAAVLAAVVILGGTGAAADYAFGQWRGTACIGFYAGRTDSFPHRESRTPCPCGTGGLCPTGRTLVDSG